MIRRADTIGVFQIESRAQMATLPRMKPERFYDLVVEVAIIRPGPITGQMVHPYLNRRAGREPVAYPHPSLEPILARTLGVPLFQEQLLRIAMTAAGFTGGEAEELRRAMGFKRSQDKMQRLSQRLRDGMTERGIAGAAQDEILRGVVAFALYGFPESHAASFALIAYASAYLKCHHPAAFLAGLLNAWPMGFYAPATLVKDAQRHGIEVRPIDVASSAWKCTLEPAERRRGHGAPPPAVRLGLRYANGLREQAGSRSRPSARAGPSRISRIWCGGSRCAAASWRRSPSSARWPRSTRARARGARRSGRWPGSSAIRTRSSRASRRTTARRLLAEMTPLEDTLADYRRSGHHVGPAGACSPARRARRARRASHRGAAGDPERTRRAHGGPRDRAPTPRDREGILLPHAGGRDGHRERHPHAAGLPPFPGAPAHRGDPRDRRAGPERGRRDPRTRARPASAGRPRRDSRTRTTTAEAPASKPGARKRSSSEAKPSGAHKARQKASEVPRTRSARPFPVNWIQIQLNQTGRSEPCAARRSRGAPAADCARGSAA